MKVDNGDFFFFSLNKSFYFYFFKFFSYCFTLFCFTILYWFCHTLTWIHHGCICVPKHEPPSHLPPHNISLGHHRAPAPSMLYPASDLDWRFDSLYLTLNQKSKRLSQTTPAPDPGWLLLSLHEPKMGHLAAPHCERWINEWVAVPASAVAGDEGGSGWDAV